MALRAAALRYVIPAIWLAWLVYWHVAAREVKPSRWREGGISRALYIIPAVLCALLLVNGRLWPAALTIRFAPRGPVLPLIGAATTAIGIGFAVWARRHLGGNWSGIVTVKEGHTLTRSGPYRIVRHPIYTGLLLALAGTAAAIGEVRGLLAFGCALLGFLRKIRVEERRMSQTFPEYRQYCAETAALIPFLY